MKQFNFKIISHYSHKLQIIFLQEIIFVPAGFPGNCATILVDEEQHHSNLFLYTFKPGCWMVEALTSKTVSEKG